MVDITSNQKFSLKKTIKELISFSGRHTEFVSIYVPQGYELNKIVNQLQQEQGTAVNIKSASTRKNVTDALERMIQHLKLFKQTPENGLAVFAGNVASAEGKNDVRIWSVEPPVPLKTKMYRCDKNFVIEPLEGMLDVKEFYGLVVLDMRDADIALLKGKAIIPLRKTHSEVPGKMRAGGQSAARFGRIREGAIKDHFKKIADYMKEQFLGMEGLKGIIIGGPGTTVNNFLNKEYLTGDIKKKVIATKDLGYTGEFGLQELVNKSEDILANEEVIAEKEIVQKFINFLAVKPGMVVYGVQEVEDALNMGAVETLLLSESLSDPILEKFEDLADKFNTEIKIISVETNEGVQIKGMGGVAAILRYEIST